MKKLILLFIGVVLFVSCNRTNTYNLSQFYNKYKNESQVSVKVPGFLARIATNDAEADRWLKKLKSAKILMIDKTESRGVGNIKSDLMRALQGENMDELLNVNSGDEYISIQVLETKDRIKKLVVGVDSEDEFVLIDTKINASFDDIAEILSDVKKDGKDAKSIQTLF